MGSVSGPVLLCPPPGDSIALFLNAPRLVYTASILVNQSSMGSRDCRGSRMSRVSRGSSRSRVSRSSRHSRRSRHSRGSRSIT